MAEYTLLKGGRVVAGAAPRGQYADIVIEGDTIRDILSGDDARPEDAHVIDASNRLLIPGLVNGHTHSHGGLAKGLGNRWTLELSLNAAPWLGGNRAAEQIYLSGQVAAAEMVLKGCTACYDLFYEFPLPSEDGMAAIARGYADIGMRAVIAPMIADRTFYEAVPGLIDALPPGLRDRVAAMSQAPADVTLAAVRQIIRNWSYPRDRIAPAIAPTIPHHCSDDFMRGCRDLAQEHELGLHMHLSESKVQLLAGERRYGRSLTQHIGKLGLLGPRFTAAHAIWLSGQDMDMLAAAGSAVVHVPGSNFRLGSGLAPIRPLLDRGIAVGVGTDGATSSDNQNMFEALRLASFVSRAQGEPHERWLSSAETLDMATVGSATALGLGDTIGRIAPGYKADIVFLDLEHLNYAPLNDALNQVVNCEDGTAVHSVMIGGRMVLEDRRHTSLDIDKLRTKVADAAAALQQANAGVRALADELAPVVATFCRGLIETPHSLKRYVGDDTPHTP